MLKGKGCTGGPDKPSSGERQDLPRARASASCPSASPTTARQPAPRADLRGHPAAAEARSASNSSRASSRRVSLFGTTLPSGQLGPHHVHLGRVPPSTEDPVEGQAPPAAAISNFGNYCNRRATKLLDTDRHNARREHPHEAPEPGRSAYMVNDVPSIPLFVAAGLHDRARRR